MPLILFAADVAANAAGGGFTPRPFRAAVAAAADKAGPTLGPGRAPKLVAGAGLAAGVVIGAARLCSVVQAYALRRESSAWMFMFLSVLVLIDLSTATRVSKEAAV